MIVIERNGRRTEITGWREWAIVLPAMFLIALGLLALLGLALGIAAALSVLIVLAIPVAILFVLIANLFGARRARRYKSPGGL
jgi:hypothetical protein